MCEISGLVILGIIIVSTLWCFPDVVDSRAGAVI